MNHLMRYAVLPAALAWGLAHPAAGQSDALLKQGYALAQDVCADCHVVDPNDSYTGRGGAPDFTDVANSEYNQQSLRVFLRTPHRTMPNLILDDREMDAITAYIMSLRTTD